MNKMLSPKVHERLKQEGAILRKRRENLALSRQVVAEALECSASLIQHIENGKDNNFVIIELLRKYYDFCEGR